MTKKILLIIFFLTSLKSIANYRYIDFINVRFVKKSKNVLMDFGYFYVDGKFYGGVRMGVYIHYINSCFYSNDVNKGSLSIKEAGSIESRMSYNNEWHFLCDIKDGYFTYRSYKVKVKFNEEYCPFEFPDLLSFLIEKDKYLAFEKFEILYYDPPITSLFKLIFECKVEHLNQFMYSGDSSPWFIHYD